MTLSNFLTKHASKKYMPKETITTEILKEQGFTETRRIEIDAPVEWIILQGVDLSGSKFIRGGQFGYSSEFVDCTFCDCAFQSNIRGKYLRCDFSNADLSGSILEQFTDCNFTKAVLRKVSFGQLKIVACNFAGADLSRASIRHTTFESCDFRRAKFHKASIYMASFYNCIFDVDALRNAHAVNTSKFLPAAPIA